nr:MAG TPA: hypothetical protein [Caudoviricetes sp.]
MPPYAKRLVVTILLSTPAPHPKVYASYTSYI